MFPVVLPTIYVAAAVVIASLFPYRYWHKETHDLMQKLSQEGHEAPHDEDDDCITLAALKERIKKLPKVVQEWMETALPLPDKANNDNIKIPFARALRIEQEGSFLLNEKWIRFDAIQEFSCRQTHPGFVWDAQMHNTCFGSLNLTFPISVRDAYVHGEGGSMKAQLPMGINIVSMKDTDDLNLGELMRWLAEATLFPFALLPQEHANNDGTELKWSAGTDPSDNSALLEFKHNNLTAKINFYFDPDTHMVTNIKTKRPRTIKSKTELTDWEGTFSEYESHGGLLVPTRMSVGWKMADEPLELYFRGKNVKFIYLMNAHTRHVHECDGIHEHGD